MYTGWSEFTQSVSAQMTKLKYNLYYSQIYIKLELEFLFLCVTWKINQVRAPASINLIIQKSVLYIHNNSHWSMCIFITILIGRVEWLCYREFLLSTHCSVWGVVAAFYVAPGFWPHAMLLDWDRTAADLQIVIWGNSNKNIHYKSKPRPSGGGTSR